MDKNTVWAIVLSTFVIVASYFFLPMIFGDKNAEASVATEVVSGEVVNQNDSNSENTILSDTLFTEEEKVTLSQDENTEPVEKKVEEKITINTGVAEVIFTTKGGDIISYKLTEHKDKDTNDFIQISDSINEWNRTCGISIGGADNQIISEIFDYELIDKYTILFKKNLFIKDTAGKVHEYTFGKKYSFKENEYMFKLDVMIHGKDNNGLDFNGTSYTLRTSPQIGPHFNQKQNRYETRQFIAYNGKKAKKVALAEKMYKKWEKEIYWGGIAGKYFMELVIPVDSTIWTAPTYSSKVEANNYANAQALFERRSYTGTDIQDSYYMYFGPRDEKSLKVYNVANNNAWNFGGYKLTNSLQTSGWLSWLETILKWCLEILHKIINNWGVCIIVMTIILKLLLFPLSKKQSLSSLKMQEIQPRLQAIQKKYANDQQRLQQETSKLYQEAGYNPASGCLPLLLQFLVIFAMYNLFNNYFEFRGAMFIPGWIPDLSTGDSILSWEKQIPIISGLTGNTLRILPIIYVGTQILSSKISQSLTPSNGQNDKTMKFMTYGMPLMFFFIFYNAPAGLLLYWLTSNIWQVGQQFVINKIVAAKKAESANKAQVVNKQKTIPPKGKKR